MLLHPIAKTKLSRHSIYAILVSHPRATAKALAGIMATTVIVLGTPAFECSSEFQQIVCFLLLIFDTAIRL
jgi:hypothetical protein